MGAITDSPFMTESEAADFLKLKAKTLRNMRWRGEGPSYRKHGSRVVMKSMIYGHIPKSANSNLIRFGP